MSDSTKTLLVLGATSAVAHSYLRLAAEKSLFANYILVARDAAKLATVEQDVTARSGAKVISIVANLGEPDRVSSIMSEIKAASDVIDECLLAYGALGDQSELQTDLLALQTLLETNFVSAAMWLESLAKQFEQQGHGHAATIGSVAGDRGRQSNYLYGATKGGLERISEGLSHRFAAAKTIHFTCIKPGFIDTPMTAEIEKSGPLWATPDQIAAIIHKAVSKKRVRVYAPWFWRYILLIVRTLPIPIFHKTKM